MAEITESELYLYFNKEIQKIINGVLKNTLKSPKETAFIIKYAGYNKANEKLKSKLEKQGLHIPPFLILSIVTACNLNCVGCYAKATAKHHHHEKNELTAQQWDDVFTQAEALGIGFSIIAGGEPLLRKDVVVAAAKHKRIVFPVFTNGTLINAKYTALFDDNRNLIPVLSIEGEVSTTDDRRGVGTYHMLKEKMLLLREKSVLYGVSITVTSKNIAEVTGEVFLRELVSFGCKIVFFVEYVPMEEGTEGLALDDTARDSFDCTLNNLRDTFSELLFLAFPGDEKYMGGCLAGGRGFFHINPYGDGEACPFAPYSDVNLATHSLAEMLKSPLFAKLKASGLVGAVHKGGCALFDNKAQVEELL